MRRLTSVSSVVLATVVLACSSDPPSDAAETGSTGDASSTSTGLDSGVDGTGTTTSTTASSQTEGTSSSGESTSGIEGSGTGVDASSSGSESGSDSSGSGSTGAAPFCGDGMLDPGEICDDGNAAEDDACSADCLTATCLVPVTHATIQLGIDDVACPTVWVMPGTYVENVTIPRDVTVEGLTGGIVEVDGGAAGSVFAIEAVTVVLRNLTITNGWAAHGAGILSSGTLTLEDTTVTGNEANGLDHGGAGISSTGSLTLVSSSVVANTLGAAPGLGAGIEVLGGSATITAGSAVSDNTIVGQQFSNLTGIGAGIYAVGAVVVVDGGSMITGNAIQIDAFGGPDNFGHGAGIAMLGGTLTVSDATVSGNTMMLTAGSTSTIMGWGAGLYLEGATAQLGPGTVVTQNTITASAGAARGEGAGIHVNTGSLSTDDVEITQNTIAVDGSGGAAIGRAFGAGLSINGAPSLQIVRSTIADNTATANGGGSMYGDLALGGGLFVEAAVFGATSTVEVTQSTLSGNQANGNGDSRGGGIAVSMPTTGDVTVVVTNSTLSGNASAATDAARGGGASIEATAGAASVVLINTTVTGNAADEGGGLYRLQAGGTEAFVLRHAIVWGNTASVGPECTPDAAVEFANLLGATTDCMVDLGDVIATDPMLAALGDNGGPTPTHAIDVTSPAYQAGQATCTDLADAELAVDQRGVARTGACTLGAFEVE